MDIKKFKNNPSGELVKQRNPNGEFWAFVPYSLPPKIKMTNKLINKLTDAGIALGTLQSPGSAVISPSLRYLLLRREALRSSEIEGTISTLVDIYAIEAKQYLPLGDTNNQEARKNAASEVLNYVSATQHGINRLRDTPVTNKLLKELHKILMKGVRGKDKNPGLFRQNQNAIGSDGDTIKSAKFVPPPVQHMKLAMDNLESYIYQGNKFHPLIRLALIHYQFEAIHPFMDGNGRIGRLILPLILNQWGLLPEPILYMSVYFQKNRDTYNTLLFNISSMSKWNEWIMFFLEGIISQAVDAKKIMNGIQIVKENWKKILSGEISQNLLRLTDLLCEFPYITIPIAAENLGMTTQGVRRLIFKLIDKGILIEIDSKGPTRSFVAPEIFDIIK